MMVWEENYGQLFVTPAVALLCGCWAIAWLLAHHVMPVNWEEQIMIGSTVRIVEAIPKFQGMEGMCERWDADADCWEVRLANGDLRMFKVEQLEAFDTDTSSNGSSRIARHAPRETTISNGSRTTLITVGSRSMGSPRSGSPVVGSRPGAVAAAMSDWEGLRCVQRRLTREILYSLIATVAGIVLLASRTPAELLTAYSCSHQVFFAMAVGHWLNKLWEEWWTRDYLALGFHYNCSAMCPFQWCCSPRNAIIAVYWIHHAIMLGIYGFILWTWSLGGLGAQLLVFEAPVLFLLRRDLAFTAKDTPMWMRQERQVLWHWRLTFAMFFLFRGPPIALWVVSLTHGLQTGRCASCVGTKALDRLAYFVAGVLLILANLHMLVMMHSCYATDVGWVTTVNRGKELHRSTASLSFRISQWATSYSLFSFSSVASFKKTVSINSRGADDEMREAQGGIEEAELATRISAPGYWSGAVFRKLGEMGDDQDLRSSTMTAGRVSVPPGAELDLDLAVVSALSKDISTPQETVIGRVHHLGIGGRLPDDPQTRNVFTISIAPVAANA